MLKVLDRFFILSLALKIFWNTVFISLKLLPLWNYWNFVDGAENNVPMNFARCTSSNLICELRPSNGNQPQDVLIKASVGKSPNVRSFFVLLYQDPYLAKPAQCWQICLHAVQKIELSATQGQQTNFSLVLRYFSNFFHNFFQIFKETFEKFFWRGGNADRMVCCFTSTDEISLTPKEPFLLQSLSTKEIKALATPKISGERSIQITAVDLELKELLQSWLIWLVCRPPNITRAFQVILPVGDQFNHGKVI